MYQAVSAPISIVIPVLNEASNLPAVLKHLQNAEAVEIIVVDGGSQDDTIAIARSLGVQVIQSARGRAHQMNAGATIASGKILLFLHADTRLPPKFDTLIRQALAQPGVVAGAFELKIDATLRGIQWVEWGVKWRSRLLQLPYGDQGIFLTAEMFLRVEGFPELPIMEDFILVQQLKQRGRIAIVPAAVLTSGRRWQKLGVFRTTLINQFILIAYFLGVPPLHLSRWYRRAS